MASARKLKRHLSDSEDGSKSDSEAETKNMTLHRSTKKKKIYLESDSENESVLSNQTSTKDEEKYEATSDEEDKPIGNISIPSKLTEKVHNSSSRSDERLHSKGRNNASSSSDDEPLISKNRNNSSSSSDDEPLISKSRNNSQGVKSKSARSRESEEDKLQVTSNDEDEPIKPVQEVLKFKGKPKDIDYSSDDSDDETVVAKSKDSSKHSETKNEAKSHISGENMSDVTSDEEPISKIATLTKSKNLGASSDDSDDEPLAAKNRNSSKNLKTNKKIKALDSESEKKKSDLTSDEDEPLNKLVKPSKASGNSKGVTSSSNSDDEPLITKSKASKQMKNSRKAKTQKPQSITNGYNSSDEEEPLSKFTSGSKSKGKPQRKKQDSNSSSDDEPSATKKSVKQKSEPQKYCGLSSDDEDESLSNLLKVPTEKTNNKKDKNSSNAKIEQLKKYLRTAGIHVQSYDKLFENCKSIKSKAEKLLDILHEKGLKGRPTIEKCKKLKKKIETKKEIAELDTSNIIKSEGRPKRGAVGKVLNTESSPVAKKFSRLQDIIDTEESD